MNETGERRQWPRLPLKLNVRFFAGGQQKAPRVGVTDNVSAGGLFFHTADWQGLEENQQVVVELSGMSGYNAGPLFRTIAGTATILRLEEPRTDSEQRKAGVAARFDERPRVDLYQMRA
ncbi:MAG: PilZ domain-containing protein [Candidatus Brocadiaceae bacterium]